LKRITNYSLTWQLCFAELKSKQQQRKQPQTQFFNEKKVEQWNPKCLHERTDHLCGKILLNYQALKLSVYIARRLLKGLVIQHQVRIS
jgi:hypothetical protein